VVVKLHNQTKTIKADKAGNWSLILAAEVAGGPYTLTVTGKNKIIFNNILFGDVWICSGQSNMEMKIAKWGFINNYQLEIDAATYPDIRQFEVKKSISTTPENDVAGGAWEICSPSTAGNFSATAYFFARKLYEELHIPIGLINTSWGGTQIESWISKGALENCEAFKKITPNIPTAEIESLLKVKEEKLFEKVKIIQELHDKDKEGVLKLGQNEYSNNSWGSINAPGIWEQQGLQSIDGNLWFKKIIVIPEKDAGKAAVLSLGMIDDDDDTYINTIKVGSTKGYDENRIYNVPAGVLKAGKNLLVLMIHDGGGNGGFYGNATAMKLSIDSNTMPLAGKWEYMVEPFASGIINIDANSFPTLLYNAMIHPLIPFSIKGAIWYQGEANVYRANQYEQIFPLMITDWRNSWHQGDFPFYFVQLSSWNENNGNSTKGSLWAELREAQAKTTSVPNTGMIITTDIGDPKDIHPKNKQDVGSRLAAIALNKTYDKGNSFAGPTFKSYEISGNKIIISYHHIGNGLLAKDKYGYIKGFEIAGKDKIFYPAKAFIEGSRVVVLQDWVQAPIAVRFGWADDASENNLYNIEGFPAAPFRTDQWKGITEGIKYQIGM
jgi:sialate O-acetylesterase